MLPLASSYSVVDLHTLGHPTRVILSGLPQLQGESVLDQREDFRLRFDHLRGALLHEPRGHAAMVALVMVPSRRADYGAFFISSYYYLDMCGHGTLGLARTLAANGQLSAGRDAQFTLETPAGVVTVKLLWHPDATFRGARIRNVPSLALPGPLVKVQSSRFGSLSIPIFYTGMWYALVDARSIGLKLTIDTVSENLLAGSVLKDEIAAATADRPEMSGAVKASVLFYSDDDDADVACSATQMLVLDRNKFDRSPCGTGTAARVAQLVGQQRLGPDGTYRARNLLGEAFLARPVEIDPATGSVTTEIEGTAYLTAFSTLLIERGDPLAGGFLPR